jgi:RHH-type proline utilization regulon transcriptional repressor/proline dehydrogenase/delta 1-pyrroline-5-carboxylate dehydrogenase
MFRYGRLCEALDRALAAKRFPTDEAQAMEWLGDRALLVEGSAGNIKITTQDDLVLAEALLRVPDARTADQFIEDKLAQGDFVHHETKSSAFLVNASAWALGMSARVIQPGETPQGTIGRLTKRLGAPAVRAEPMGRAILACSPVGLDELARGLRPVSSRRACTDKH